MLPVDSATIRIFLHILATCVWIGGQILLVALLPVLRPLGPEAVAKTARRFEYVAWPAFAVLIITGIWNIAEVDLDTRSDEYLATFSLKMTFVTLSGVCAALHAFVAGPRAQRARKAGRSSAKGWAIFSGVMGAGGLLFALGAAFAGVQLRG